MRCYNYYVIAQLYSRITIGNYNFRSPYNARYKTIIFNLPGIENKTFKAIIPANINVNPGETAKFNLERFFLFAEDGRRLV